MQHAVCEKQSPFSFVGGLQARIETGKAIIGEIVPQALKSYQHEGWDWLGGHLWPHALSWHEVALAIACQFPPAPGFPIPLLLHQALLPGSLFLLLHLLLSLQTLLACYCPRMVKEREKKKIFTVQWVWQRLKVCNHAVLFLIMITLIVDTSRGENVLDCVGVVEERTVKIPKDQKPQNNSMSNTVKIWAGGVWFGPKGTVGESSRH